MSIDKGKISIMLVNSHTDTLLREAWAILLKEDQRFNVVAEANNIMTAVSTAWAKMPSIVIIISGKASSIDILRRIKKQSSSSKLIFITAYTDLDSIRETMKEGVRGYLTKNSYYLELIEAIVEVNKGNVYLGSEIKNVISDQMITNEKENILSKRELEIIALLKMGRSTKEICHTLSISSKTVNSHRYNIFKKLQVKNTLNLLTKLNKIVYRSNIWQ